MAEKAVDKRSDSYNDDDYDNLATKALFGLNIDTGVVDLAERIINTNHDELDEVDRLYRPMLLVANDSDNMSTAAFESKSHEAYKTYGDEVHKLTGDDINLSTILSDAPGCAAANYSPNSERGRKVTWIHDRCPFNCKNPNGCLDMLARGLASLTITGAGDANNIHQKYSNMSF